MKSKVRPFLPVLIVVALAAVPVAPGQGRKAQPTAPHPALKALDEMGAALVKLEDSHQSLMRAVGELEGLYAKLSEKAGEVSRLAAEVRKTKAPGDAASRLFQATEEMQKMQMSFNLQYLQLQNNISHENRQFSMISNIMKHKHDTAKSAINNIR